MELENQVVSLELAKKLKELGVEQESLFYWKEFRAFRDGEEIEPNYYLKTKEEVFDSGHNYFSAFTVAELGEMLPSEINFPFKNGKRRSRNSSLKSYFGNGLNWKNVIYTKAGEAGAWVNGNTEADARAKMFIYLIENKKIWTKSIR